MGQRDEYLNDDPMWDNNLSPDDRLEQWWTRGSFGLALSGRAARAVKASEDAVEAAELAAQMVRHQAAYALLDEGRSVRQVAQQLALTKSTVGRVSKRLGDGHDLAWAQPRGQESATRSLVLDAWGFEDLNEATQDHISGTPGPPKKSKSTNFGGLNG